MWCNFSYLPAYVISVMRLCHTLIIYSFCFTTRMMIIEDCFSFDFSHVDETVPAGPSSQEC